MKKVILLGVSAFLLMSNCVMHAHQMKENTKRKSNKKNIFSPTHKKIKKKPNVFHVDTSKQTVACEGQTYDYTQVLEVKASAYSDDESENGCAGGVDACGNPLVLGTISVDPKVIPLGTKAVVTGYDANGLPEQCFLATARDTGSSIKGNKVDIYIPGTKEEAQKFGIQNVTVYILK